MSQRLRILVAVGLSVFFVGGIARTYMNIQLRGWRSFIVPARGLTERQYGQLIRERGAPMWLLILSVSCIPLGIAIVFGAILWAK